RIAYSALAHHLHLSKNWTEKAERCLALFDKGIDPAAVSILDEALAEILQAKTAVPELLGKFRDAKLRIVQLMAILDGRYAIDDEAYGTGIARRLHESCAVHPMPALREAIISLTRRLLMSSVPLLSE